MEPSVLIDKNQFPNDQLIFSHIGIKKTLWQLLFNYIENEHTDITTEWRYYNDGKSWLMKVTRKSKTIFWLSVVRGTFGITFYFNDKVEDALQKSNISSELKKQFKEGKRFNKIRGITIFFKNKKDVEYAKELVEMKLSTK
jgi:hypothetical protein